MSKQAWFCVFNSAFEEEFIGRGETAKDAFDEVNQMTDDVSLEDCKFYFGELRYPVKVTHEWVE